MTLNTTAYAEDDENMFVWKVIFTVAVLMLSLGFWLGRQTATTATTTTATTTTTTTTPASTATTAKTTCTVKVQSQTTYQYYRATPRVHPLPDRDHGAWSD